MFLNSEETVVNVLGSQKLIIQPYWQFTPLVPRASAVESKGLWSHRKLYLSSPYNHLVHTINTKKVQ